MERFNGKHGWNPVSQFQEEDFERCAVLFYHEAGNGTAGCIAKEILSFVSAVVPEKCAREWMIQSGAMEPSEFLQAVSDMEDVRLRARLLALELAAMNAKYNVLDTIPWDRLN